MVDLGGEGRERRHRVRAVARHVIVMRLRASAEDIFSFFLFKKNNNTKILLVVAQVLSLPLHIRYAAAENIQFV